MKSHFLIYDGTLDIREGVIIINDNKKPRYKIMLILGSFILILPGLLYLYLFLNDPKSIMMALPGAILLISGLSILINRLRMSWQNILDIQEVKKVVIRSYRFNYLKADFHLESGKRRRVVLDINDHFGFSRNELESFRLALNNKNIICEIE